MADAATNRRRGRIEIVELVVLAIVAIATAWSGFQATTWGGRQSELYGQASALRFQADAASTVGGQQLVADVSLLTAWLQAEDAGDRQLQDLLVRRFTPDYRVAFDAWLALDPLHNRDAPPGPGYMPTYHNPRMDEAAQLNDQASADFAAGTEAREHANAYARDTVLFATVLFFVAIAQRFTQRRIRFAANGVAIVLLIFTLASVAVLPRAT